MSELITIPAAELAELKERLNRLAREKAQLQLIALLMNRLSEVPGLERTVEGMLQFMMEILGGLNVTIFYRLDEAIHCVDVDGRKEVVGEIQDDLVRQVFETHEFVSREREFSQTGLMTKEFTKATTWVMPLLVGDELLGVLRIEDLLMAGRELRDEVQPFLRYVSLVLKNEISGETRLRRAFDEVNRATRAEAALAAQHSTLRGIIEGSTSPIFSLDREYRYVAFNQSHASTMRALYGAEIEAGRSIFDYQTVTEDREKAKKNLDRALAGEHLVESAFSGEEHRTRRYFEVSHHPVLADDGQVVGAAVFVNDITERKRAEDALYEAQEVFRALVETSPDIIARYDRDCRRTYVNPTYLKVAQIPQQELIATSPAQHSPLPPASAAVLQALLCKVRDSGVAEAVDVIWPKADGVGYWYNIFAFPEFDREGHVVSVMTVSRDITARKRAEEALRKSEERLRLEVARMPIGYVIWDKDFRVVTWNPAAEGIFGFTFDEARGRHPYEIIVPPKAQPQVDDIWRRLLEGDAAAHSVNENQTKDGRTIVCDWTNTPLKQPDGTVLGVMSMVQDITERVRAEEEIVRVNRALRMLSDTNQALIHITDEATLLNEVCRIAVDVGSSRMAWVCFAEHDEGRTLRPVAHAGLDSEYVESARLTWADDERGRGPAGTSVRTGQPCIFRSLPTDPAFAPWRDPASQRGYKSIISLPLISEGQTLGALLIYAGEEDAFDSREVEILKELAGDLAFGITALRTRAKRERAEEALHKREVELNESQRLAHIGSWDWDAVKDIIWWSPEYYRIYGLDPNQPAANYVEHLNAYNAEGVQRLDAVVKRAMETGEPYEVDLELAQPSASTRWVVARGEAKRDAEGRIWGLRGTAQNITERKGLEEERRRLNLELESRVEERTAELAEAVKELESFSYSVSHDLRAPLRAIDGFSSLLEGQSGGILDEEGRRLLQVIRKNTHQMGRLIDDLLSFSRSSRTELRKTTIDMNGLVNEILDGLLPAAERERTEVHVAKLPAACGDGGLVRVVLQNLLSNALKYSAPRERRCIEIGCRQGDDGPQYFIRDNGVGFDPRYADKLFGVFQRLHSAKEFEGTGIGLALVKRIVNRHGGKVWAEGAVNRGATFWFTLGGAGTASS